MTIARSAFRIPHIQLYIDLIQELPEEEIRVGEMLVGEQMVQKAVLDAALEKQQKIKEHNPYMGSK